jgi:arylsulfatase A-like enzyme
MPSETDHDRYVQELRNSDEQMGRLLEGLREEGRLKDTVVIFFGDHGEEFQEHGGSYHKATVYTEVTQVPLLVYLPGMSGQEMHRPLSTYYVLPWLLRTGSEKMREPALRRIQEDISPMMRATDGAVVIELIGHDRMMSSLVYQDEKYNYDFLSSMYEVYDVQNDRLEQKDRFDTDIELAQRGVEKMESYLTVRAARANFILKPQDVR